MGQVLWSSFCVWCLCLFSIYLDNNFWLKFLRDAGLPQETAKRYADRFCENRLTLQHLRHLDKDLLKEMKINAVGDIITILQHCKSVDVDVRSVYFLIHIPL